MTTMTLEQELQQLEEQYWQAMKTSDTQAMERLTAFPCLVTGPQGVMSIDRNAFVKMMQDSTSRIESVRLSDVQVRPVTDDVAVVASKVHRKITVDGKPVTIEAADLSVWTRRDGDWVCPAHSESILGDPYGRDSQK